jgi:SNF2 family DNA or RNA helicase
VQVTWLRVVLDEGHCIRNAATMQSRAAATLPARSRWVISGTPIQNSMKDLYGLLAFLHLQPLSERDVFNASVDRPLRNGNPDGPRRVKVLLGAIALRRLKTTKVLTHA